MPTYTWHKGGEYSKNRVYNCGYLRFSGIMQNIFVEFKNQIEAAVAVCSGVKILTSIIHGLLLNEESFIKRQEIFLGRRTAGYSKSKKRYRSFLILSIFYKGGLLCVES